MMLMPSCCAARGVGMSTSAPFRRIRPASLWYTPARIFISVDLPAPFSPTSAWISPARRSKRQLRSAWTPGKSLLIPSISTSRSPTASGTTPPTGRIGAVADPRRPHPVLARSFGLLVQQRGDVRVVDVRLVVVLVARVDVLGERLTLEGVHRGLDALEADADRVLCDRARLGPGADRVHLLLTRVIADDRDLAGLVRFLHAVEHADRRTLVRAEDALEVRVRLKDRLREVGGLELIPAAVLRRDDLDVRVLVLDLVGEALHAVDAGAAGLVVRDDRDFTGSADEAGHLVRRGARRRDVVGCRGRERDVAVDAGVESDDGDIRVLELLEQRDRGLAVERREAQRRRLLVQHGLQHLELLVDLRLVLRSLEIDPDVEL